jgi:hypothetical protein
MQNKPVMRIEQIFFWNAFEELLLDFQHVFSRGKAGAIRYPEDMGVDCHGGLSKRRIQNNIGCFAAYSWQGFKCFTGARDFATMPLQ